MSLKLKRIGAKRSSAEEMDLPASVRQYTRAVLERRIGARIGVLNVKNQATAIEMQDSTPPTSTPELLLIWAIEWLNARE